MNITERFKRKVNLVDYIGKYTTLRKAGNTYRGLCPIHGSKESETICVYPEQGDYFCYSCSSGGNIINFVADMNKTSYENAIEILANEFNINIKNDKQYQQEKSIVEQYEKEIKQARRQVGKVKNYLQERGLSDKTIEDFGLGYDDMGLVIPIQNHVGRTVAIAHRQFERKPKYINSYNNELYDKSSLLFGYHQARKLIKDRLYLVEGYMDAMSGYEMGVPTVAYCGSSILVDQMKALGKLLRHDITLIYCPDNDDAGKKDIDKIRQRFKRYLPKVQVRILPLGEGIKDFNDLLTKEKNYKDYLTLEKTIHIDRYCIRGLLEQCTSLEEQYEVADEYLKTVKITMVKHDIIKELADKWGRNVDVLMDYFNTPKEDVDELTKDASFVDDCLNDLKRLYNRGGYKTHFKQLDRCIGEISKKQVFVIGAYSSSGKSDMAIEYILRQVQHNKARIIFFSLEMPKGKVLERMIAKIVGCKLSDVREVVEKNEDAIREVISRLEKYLIIYDNNNLDMTDIENRIHAVNQRGLLGGDVDIVVLDYFTYLKGANTFEKASEQALKLKGIAKKYNIVFTVLSQISRKGNTYEEPTMDMLRMTGDLEASADVILMMWRPDRQPNLSLEQEEKLKYITRMKVEKARDGMYGPNKLSFRYDINTSRLVEDCKI